MPSTLKRGRKKARADPMPTKSVAMLRTELKQMGFLGLSRLTKIELALKYEREEKRLVKKARQIEPTDGPVL